MRTPVNSINEQAEQHKSLPNYHSPSSRSFGDELIRKHGRRSRRATEFGKKERQELRTQRLPPYYDG